MFTPVNALLSDRLNSQGSFHRVTDCTERDCDAVNCPSEFDNQDADGFDLQSGEFSDPERLRSCDERPGSLEAAVNFVAVAVKDSSPKSLPMVAMATPAPGNAPVTDESASDGDYFRFDADDREGQVEEDFVDDTEDDDDDDDEDQDAAVFKAEAAAAADGSADASGIFACHLCEYTGISREAFRQHMGTHYDQQCPKCDYKCRTGGRLRRHVRDFHSDVPPPTYTGRATGPKLLRCKQCSFTALDKTAFWEHARSHIKAARMLQCPKCPFVTEYKHHLEYHIRNHFGSKPYKCGKCNYQCVNRSMLNSHLKSHTNVYQHRCRDCGYASKYCHSLRQHLKKYGHAPAATLNPDGSMPEVPLASAAKRKQRRKQKKLSDNSCAADQSTAVTPDTIQSRQHQPVQHLAPLIHLPPPRPQPQVQLPWQLPYQPIAPPKPPPPLPPPPQTCQHPLQLPLDLSVKPQITKPMTPPPVNVVAMSAFSSPSHYKKKRLIEDFEKRPTTQQQQKQQQPASCSSSSSTPSQDPTHDFECEHCGLLFRDQLMYHLHMAFHGLGDNPFRCSRCGSESRDRLEFFVHLARTPH